MLPLAVQVIAITLLLSTTTWLTPPAAITRAALAQTAITTCYGHTATIVGTPESENIVGTE